MTRVEKKNIYRTLSIRGVHKTRFITIRHTQKGYVRWGEYPFFHGITNICACVPFGNHISARNTGHTEVRAAENRDRYLRYLPFICIFFQILNFYLIHIVVITNSLMCCRNHWRILWYSKKIKYYIILKFCCPNIWKAIYLKSHCVSTTTHFHTNADFSGKCNYYLPLPTCLKLLAVHHALLSYLHFFPLFAILPKRGLLFFYINSEKYYILPVLLWLSIIRHCCYEFNPRFGGNMNINKW